MQQKTKKPLIKLAEEHISKSINILYEKVLEILNTKTVLGLNNSYDDDGRNVFNIKNNVSKEIQNIDIELIPKNCIKK